MQAPKGPRKAPHAVQAPAPTPTPTPGPTRRRGRPAGELNQALAAAARDKPGTVGELAARALVGQAVARYTASRMAARGELVPVGTVRRPGVGRPAVVYGVPQATPDAPPGPDALHLALRGWFGALAGAPDTPADAAGPGVASHDASAPDLPPMVPRR